MPDFKRTISVDYKGEWDDAKYQMSKMLKSAFNNHGLRTVEDDEKLVFKRIVQSATDSSDTSRAEFYMVLREAEINISKSINKSANLEFKIDLSYLIVFSICIGMVFCLGLYPLSRDIGAINYLALIISAMFVTGLIGYFAIRGTLKSIIEQIFI